MGEEGRRNWWLQQEEVNWAPPTHLDAVPLLLPLVHLIFHLDDLQLQLLLLQRQLGLWGGEEGEGREPGELGLRVAPPSSPEPALPR